jgi:hypothetical protein
MVKELWTRKEMLICLAYYSTLSYPKVIDTLAAQECSLFLPGRSVASVSLRLANYVARDPQMTRLGFKGMYGGGEKVDEIWDECSDRDRSLDWKKTMMALIEVTAEHA